MKLSAAHLPTGDFASLEASDAEKFAVVVVTKARGDRETMCPPRCMASKARIHTHTHMIIYIYTHVICNNYITFCHVIYRISLCCIFVLPFGRKLSLACLKTNRINDFHPVGRTKTVATIQHAAAR
jgi:hypothetical protein